MCHRSVPSRTHSFVLRLASLLLGLALISPSPAPSAQDVRAAPASAPAAKRITAPAGTATAWFRLDPQGVDPMPALRPSAVARWVTGPLDPEQPEGGRRVELELRWLDEDVRLLVAERVLAREHRVLWREQLPRGGRTVLITVDREDPGADLRVTETSAGRIHRRSLSRDRGAWQLLSLVEAAGRGVEPHGHARVLMPQRAAVERVGLRLEPDPAGGRALALTFPDGTQGPRFRFEGSELVGFLWQAGGPVATRIEGEEHARWIRFGGGDEHDQG